MSAVADHLAQVVESPLWSLRDVEVEELIGQAQAAAVQLAELSLRLVAEAGRRDLPPVAGAPSTRAWLRARWRLCPAAAKKTELLANRLDRGCAATRAALAGGRVDVEQAGVIARVVADLPAQTDPGLVDSAEARLVEEAATFDAAELARLGQRILEVVDPDGADARLGAALAAEEARYAKRSLAVTPDLDGMIRLTGRLDSEGGAVLGAALEPLAAPRPTDADGPDVRSSGQRYADALVEVCRRALAGGQLPHAGGTKPQLSITVDYHALAGWVGVGRLDTGGHLGAGAIRRLACDASLIPAVLGTASAPLDLGRSVRLINGPLRRALVLRDRGCAFPGCPRPPSWCDGHHIKHWIDGGPTSLANAVLLCGHHHRIIHQGHWAVTMGHDGHPDFHPPEWIDPDRKPLRNTLHRRT